MSGAVVVEALARGREAYELRAWADAYAQLSAADRARPLEPVDLQRLAAAAYLLGREEDSVAIWTRAHRELSARGDRAGAARCAFWLAYGFLNRGEVARCAGWLARARRELADEECAESGLLVVPDAIRQVQAGDCAGALAVVDDVIALGERCGDPDLTALARSVRGRALVRLGRLAEGLTLLDEVMVAVLADEISPVLAGDLYCTVIEGCQDAYDLRRAQEWTAALSRWCDAQPDLVPYRGQCLVHRAEIMLLHGAWPDAWEAARSSYEHLVRPPTHPAVGAACYLLAELSRLSGDFGGAETAYREASQWGRQSQPGLALLRLAQGQVEAAVAGIDRALAEETDRAARPALLAAAVEILLVAADLVGARTRAEELSTLATETDSPLLGASAAQATGAVLVAEGDTRAALVRLRRAWTLWHGLSAPYHAAQVRVLLGMACRDARDEDGAQLEFAAAASALDRLGAAPDSARVAALSRGAPSTPSSGLTVRETEVLRLVASGKSNRAIARELFISESTVARHVSNILTKLDLPSRSAATAHALRHGLV